MTNVDIIRKFADEKGYYFEHGRDTHDFANLYDADSENDSQIKIFHWTSGFRSRKNGSGAITGVDYRGAMFILIKSDLDETIDVQKDVPVNEGKYEKRVKPLIDGGGFEKELIDYICFDYDYETDGEAQEVYNLFDFNADGIWIKYKLFVEK